MVDVLSDCVSTLWLKFLESRDMSNVLTMPACRGSVNNYHNESLHFKDAIETKLDVSGGGPYGGVQQNLQVQMTPRKETTINYSHVEKLNIDILIFSVNI